MSLAIKERPARLLRIRTNPERDGERLVKLRAALGWSRARLARVMNASDRAIVNWEAGAPISPVYAAKLREIQGVYNELKQLMKAGEIGPWLLAEMDEFEGQSPADLIAKGEAGRLWASLFYLRSGMPD
jgi:transcriptional regulator with XRE-family HTH domain